MSGGDEFQSVHSCPLKGLSGIVFHCANTELAEKFVQAFPGDVMEKVWPTRTFGRGETFYAGHSRSRSRKDRSFFSVCLFAF